MKPLLIILNILFWIIIISSISWYLFLNSLDPVISRAEPYLDEIILEDIELRKQAISIISDCPQNDKTCYVNKIYQHIVKNYNYYPDPRKNEFIQNPYETLSIKGGDCEDLTILLNSYLENLGVETYIVLTDTHAYSLACEIDSDLLFEYIQESLTELIAKELGKEQELKVIINNGEIYLVDEINQEVNLDRGEVYYYGGDGSKLEYPLKHLNIEYSISSSEPVDVYIVPTREDFNLLVNDETFMHYRSCQNENIISISDDCNDLEKYGGIIIQNPDFKKDIIFSLNIKFYFKYSSDNILAELLEDKGVTRYEINNKTCVVLDATAGKYSYAGYDGELEGEKIAINSLTKEYHYLE